MDAKSVLPKLENCPKCDAKLKTVRYGMFATPPGNDEIDGGSLVDPNAPSKACPECDWQGGEGGRTWETNFTQTIFEADPSNPSDDIKRKVNMNLLSLTNEEIIEFGKYNLAARFELVFRGLEPSAVDEFYGQFSESESALLPLLKKEVAFAYYNSSAQKVEQVCYFSAQQYDHHFQYLRTGMRDWNLASGTLQEFHDVVFSMKKPDVTGWVINFPDDVSDEGRFATSGSYGSEVIKAMMSDGQISIDELATHATSLTRQLYWPHWFDRSLYLTNWTIY